MRKILRIFLLTLTVSSFLLTVYINKILNQSLKTSICTSARHTTTGNTQPKFKSIYFLKVHKTGSTTIYNMLARYAIGHNLSWTPYQTRPYELTSAQFNPLDYLTLIVPPYNFQSNKYNIIADHSVFNKRAIETILEAPVGFITVLRNPVSHMRSYIMHLSDMLGVNIMLKRYSLEHTDPLISVLQAYNKSEAGHISFPQKHYFINPVAKQLGLTSFPNGSRNPAHTTEFTNHLEKISENFVIGMTEDFHTSLVIFRRLLGLSTRDIIFIKLRQTNYNPLHALFNHTDSSLYKQVCMLSPLDCQIYKHFRSIHEARVEAGGVDLQAETFAFKSALNIISPYCEQIHHQLQNSRMLTKDSPVWKSNPLSVKPSRWSDPFNVTPQDCAVMRIEERALGSYFYFRQNWEECEKYRIKIDLKCPIYDDNIKGMNCSRMCIKSLKSSDLLQNLLNEKGAYIWT